MHYHAMYYFMVMQMQLETPPEKAMHKEEVSFVVLSTILRVIFTNNGHHLAKKINDLFIFGASPEQEVVDVIRQFVTIPFFSLVITFL